MSQSGSNRTPGGSGDNGVDTINTISPDVNGNFSITGGDNITITAGANSIVIDGPATISPIIVGKRRVNDYSTIQAGIDAAHALSPSGTRPIYVYIKPDIYEESLVFYPFVYLIGLAGSSSGFGQGIGALPDPLTGVNLLGTQNVNVGDILFQNIFFLDNGSATVNVNTQTEPIAFQNCTFLNGSSLSCCVLNSNSDFVQFNDCFFTGNGGGPLLTGLKGKVNFFNCQSNGVSDAGSSEISGTSTFIFSNCSLCDAFNISDSGSVVINNSIIYSELQTPFVMSDTSNLTIFNSAFQSTPSSGYLVSGSCDYVSLSGVTYDSHFDPGLAVDPTLYATSGVACTSIVGNISFDGGNTAIETNGQLIIGNSSTGIPTIGHLTCNDGTITVTNGNGTIDIEITAAFVKPSLNYEVSATDRHVGANTSVSSPTIKLLASPGVGKTYSIKDINANAAVNNVIVDGNGKNIDGSATHIMNVNRQSATFVYNGSEWSIV